MVLVVPERRQCLNPFSRFVYSRAQLLAPSLRPEGLMLPRHRCSILLLLFAVHSLVLCLRLESQILVRWNESPDPTSTPELTSFRGQIWFSSRSATLGKEELYRMNGDGKDISPIKGVNGLLENAIVANEHLWFATTEGVYRTLLNGSGAERVSGIEANKDGGLRDLLFTYKFVEIGKDVWVITNNGIFRIPSTGA